MRKLGILIGLIAITVLCGAISAGLLNDPVSGLLIKQTSNPDASSFTATPVQAFQLVAWFGFVLFNIVGIALTIAAFFWLMNRSLAGVRRATPTGSTSTAITTAQE